MLKRKLTTVIYNLKFFVIIKKNRKKGRLLYIYIYISIHCSSSAIEHFIVDENLTPIFGYMYIQLKSIKCI